MKRSEINRLIIDAIRFLDSRSFRLPEWAYWTTAEWGKNRKKMGRVAGLKLGWDITDFGSGEFHKKGLLLFTIRNGISGSREYGKDYAEKIMIARKDQVTPLHFHFSKMEDIINRGGGRLLIKIYGSMPDESRSASAVRVRIDEVEHEVGAGGEVVLEPGQSITLEPHIYHEFRTPDETILLGEVSRVNDDARDNRFFEPVSRFAEIEDDEPAKYFLCGEYPL